MQGTEQAIRSVLRFLFADRCVGLCFPTRDESLESLVDEAPEHILLACI